MSSMEEGTQPTAAATKLPEPVVKPVITTATAQDHPANDKDKDNNGDAAPKLTANGTEPNGDQKASPTKTADSPPKPAAKPAESPKKEEPKPATPSASPLKAPEPPKPTPSPSSADKKKEKEEEKPSVEEPPMIKKIISHDTDKEDAASAHKDSKDDEWEVVGEKEIEQAKVKAAAAEKKAAEEKARLHKEEAAEKEEPSKKASPAASKATPEKKADSSAKEDEGDGAGSPQGKRVLPKWMVENADDLPEAGNEEEKAADEMDESAEASAPADVAVPASEGRGRGRGRGRGGRGRGRGGAREPRPTGDAGGEAGSDSPSRPRRSTTKKVDYANPDAATVAAEIDDADESNTSRAPRKAVRAPKRKSTEESGEDDYGQEDSGSDYDSRKKRGGAAASPRARGRGRGRGRGRPSAGAESASKRPSRAAASRGSKKAAPGSDEEEGEEVGEEQYQPRPSKRRAPADEDDAVDEPQADEPMDEDAGDDADTSGSKQPPKKRGRPPAKAKTTSSPAKPAAE
uniref:Uncharacterized protein n=1 Tax=Plectus sambesii TaxID=2011161 RepID=A0A914VQN4_9BILA